MTDNEQSSGAEPPMQGSTEPFTFIEAVGPFPQMPNTGIADQTPRASLADPRAQAEVDAFDAAGESQ